MTNIGQITQALGGDSNKPELLAFSQFLQNHYLASESLTEQVMAHFFRRALSFAHWRENRTQLHQTLGHFLSEKMGAAASELKVAYDWQVIEIERPADLRDILTQYLESQIDKDDRFRLTTTPGGRVLALILHASGTFQVRIFTNQVTLSRGQLIPLLDDMSLTYGSNLEMSPQVTQHFEVGPHMYGKFQVTEAGYQGYLIRGYMFTRFERINGGPLHAHPNLFYPLKRVEQFFIDRASDPLYQETVRMLERVSVAFKSGEDVSAAQGWLKRAKTAYEHIFIEDRLLGLMIRDLTRLDESKSLST